MSVLSEISPSKSPERGVRQVGFLLIGGAHQMLHLAPIAARLAAVSCGLCVPRLFVGTSRDKHLLRGILHRLGADDLPIERLTVGGLNYATLWSGEPALALKVPRLLAGWPLLRRLDALVVAERTSTLLKFLPGYPPLLIHIPHGAGDRARGFERRIRLFDYVIVAGEKDRDRMIADGLVTPERCLVSGYVKLAAVLDTKAPSETRLFENDAPIVLYNPHFSGRLGSWKRFARTVAEAVLQQSNANLIIAPHVRLGSRLGKADCAWLDSLAADPRVIVDLDSPRLSDMTYTLAADVYIGDVSSQVYEFLYRPKPCIFLNASGANWETDPNFAFWRFGDVVAEPVNTAATLRTAISNHGRFETLQIEGVQRALGPYRGACERAAFLICEVVGRRLTGDHRSPVLVT